MLFFQNLVDETQMPKPQKYTDTFILTKKLFIVGLRGLQNISIPVERPCKRSLSPFNMHSRLCKLVKILIVCTNVYIISLNEKKKERLPASRPSPLPIR